MLTYGNNKSWLRLVFSLRGSEFARIRYRLLAVFILSVGLTYVQEVAHRKSPLTIPALSLMGLALGIFLGFRNNTSYDRFWEGRKLWGSLVNVARSLSRNVITFAPSGSEADGVRRQVYRVVAFVHALRMGLRDQTELSQLEGLLSPADIERVRSHKNVPNAILLCVAEDLAAEAQSGRLSEFRHIALTNQLDQLSDVQGGCERIKSTPIPHSYNILMHRIVAMYVFVVPFGLVQTLHLFTPLVVLLVAYTFLGLDAVGDEIEDPFGYELNDLPLDTLSRMIEVNLRQSLGETDVPPLLEPVNNLLT